MGRALCVASGDELGVGSGYVFDREGTNWTEIGKLIASDGLVADQFGAAAAVMDRAGLMGLPMKTRSLTQNGMAYSYVLPVPEPSAVLLACATLGALVTLRRPA